MKEMASLRRRNGEDNFENFHANGEMNLYKNTHEEHLQSHHHCAKTKSKSKLQTGVNHSAHKKSLSEISPNNLQDTGSNINNLDGCNDLHTETKRKHKHKRKRNHRDKSFEELSDRKKQIELELQALDDEEAAQSRRRKKNKNNSHHHQEEAKSVRIKQELTTDDESNARAKKVRSEFHHRHDTQKFDNNDGDRRKYTAKHSGEIRTVKIKQEPRNDDNDYHRKNFRRDNNRNNFMRSKREPSSDEDNQFQRRTKANPRIPANNRIKEERDSNPHPRHPNHFNFRRGNAATTSDAENTEWGRPDQQRPAKKEVKEKEKPNFEVSGRLAEDTNTYNGVVIKYNEPVEACKPRRRWRLYPFKGNDSLPFIPIHRQSAYLLGRTRTIADIPIDHPSCSKQHAVLQFRLIPYTREDGSKGRSVRPYIIDLESSNGTFINNKQIEPRRYMELFEKDVLKFGFSSRVYVILHEESKINKEEDDEGVTEESPS